jgi:DNA-binding NarL/FixJ family response regulator
MAGMDAGADPPLIACVNSSEDVVLLLRDLMLEEGWRAVTHVTPLRYGSAPVIQFLRQLQPDVAVYTVSLPFRESWAEFQQLRAAVPGVSYVLTTTNKEALDEIVGPTEAVEIIGKPFDIDQVVEAVRRALDARWHA